MAKFDYNSYMNSYDEFGDEYESPKKKNGAYSKGSKVHQKVKKFKKDNNNN